MAGMPSQASCFTPPENLRKRIKAVRRNPHDCYVNMNTMKRNVLLFGGTGHLGRSIAAALKEADYDTIAVVRTKEKGEAIRHLVRSYFIADVTRPETLKPVFADASVVVSSLGKPVSPFSNDNASFYDIDFKANSNILDLALKGNICKFVYVSAFGAENHPNLAYFKAHHLFSQKLMDSGLDYSIIKPPALFSAFIDMITMAEKGSLFQVGCGDKLTNPIDENELAAICVAAIAKSNCIEEPGGKTTYSRREITSIIQNAVNPSRKVRTIPFGLYNTMLPVVKLLNRNQYDKYAFFAEVLKKDTIANKQGNNTLENYISAYLDKNRQAARV
jgi:uncharacterized protein YbjT (DUF2867 family)